ncbi:MAG TPA: glutaminyl-peptide cyclotransferase [Thermoplasmata archaeon]|nr:glutaminyl-peptide cyclotransferase [Thermoplasmata archaeon]
MNRLFTILCVGLLFMGLLGLLGIIFSYSCLDSVDSKTSDIIPVYTYKVVNTYPHDQKAYTQGLAFENGFLYEGTGIYGSSTLRKVDLETGRILQICKLPQKLFGEGVTIHKDKIIQLTWRSNVGFVHNKSSFELKRKFNYSTEGWGITSDGKHLILSDGTAVLHYLDPDTFEEVGKIKVQDNKRVVSKLNELEFVQGRIYANVWKSNWIAIIEPRTQKVVGWIDLEGLLIRKELSNPAGVLNGIAYDAENDRLFVTGKMWPSLFEIELIKKSTAAPDIGK